METRAWLWARELSRREQFKVAFLVRDYGQPARQRIDGVAVVKYPTHERARPTVDPYVNPVYSRIGADVFVTFGVHWLSAEVVRSAREFGARSVVCVASDSDLSDEYRLGSTARNASGEYASVCHQALVQGDRVVVQTTRQQQLARARFGLDATLLCNPVDVGRAVRLPTPRRRYVLWVGRSDPVFKRPQLCLELAWRCPELPFVAVMNRCDAQFHEQLERDAPPNILFVDRVPFGEIPTYYRDAALLVNTSSTEGFPNVFLQAGARGVPILSLQADPDGILRSGAGWVANGDIEALARKVRQVWRRPERAAAFRRRFWEHIRIHHDLERNVDRLGDLLVDTADAPLGVAA